MQVDPLTCDLQQIKVHLTLQVYWINCPDAVQHSVKSDHISKWTFAVDTEGGKKHLKKKTPKERSSSNLSVQTQL